MKRAFTIVELLVVMALVAIVSGASVSVSLQAGRRKAVDRAAEDLAQSMRQARDFAQAGKKDTTQCGSGTSAIPLEGWKVDVVSNSYTVKGICGTDFGIRTVNFQGGVTATTGTALFRPISQSAVLTGTFPIWLSATGTSYKNTVTVSSGGEVKVGL